MADVELPDLPAVVSITDSDLLHVRQGLEDKKSTVTTLETYLDTKYLRRDDDLSTVDSAATSRTNLGLGSVSTFDAGTGGADFRDNAANDLRFLQSNGNQTLNGELTSLGLIVEHAGATAAVVALESSNGQTRQISFNDVFSVVQLDGLGNNEKTNIETTRTGSVELGYSGVPKLETTSTGVNTIGDLQIGALVTLVDFDDLLVTCFFEADGTEANRPPNQFGTGYGTSIMDSFDFGVQRFQDATNRKEWSRHTENGGVTWSGWLSKEDEDTIAGTSIGFTGGSITVKREGGIVTISGSLNHASTTNIVSDTNALPSWALPETGAVSVLYDFDLGAIRNLQVDNSRRLNFIYRNFSGSLVSVSGTDNFTITYPVNN